jgi:hypothetical protein
MSREEITALVGEEDDDELRALELQSEELLAELLGHHAAAGEQTLTFQRQIQAEQEKIETELVNELQPLEASLQDFTDRSAFPEVVSINVGGTVFTTTVETLRQEQGSMLDVMFSGRFHLGTDREGNYFLDRDGEAFGYILSYLRTGTLPEDISAMTLRRLKVEADYYGLDTLLSCLERGVKKTRPQFAILNYTLGFAPSNFMGQNPEGIELAFFQDDCYRSCRDMTEVLADMKEKGWSLTMNVPPMGGGNSKGRLIFRKDEPPASFLAPHAAQALQDRFS